MSTTHGYVRLLEIFWPFFKEFFLSKDGEVSVFRIIVTILSSILLVGIIMYSFMIYDVVSENINNYLGPTEDSTETIETLRTILIAEIETNVVLAEALNDAEDKIKLLEEDIIRIRADNECIADDVGDGVMRESGNSDPDKELNRRLERLMR